LALNLGVLVSGNGTNLQAILDAVARGALDARVRCVVSNKSDAAALDRARSAGVPALSISHKAFATREAFDEAVLASLREHGVEWVVLAGFMRVLTPSFLRAWGGRVLNVHPALLPSFPGVNALGQALAHGVKVTGCTVHFVDEGVDSGPIIAQRAVPVLDGDDEMTLGARVHEAEHELLVSVLGDVAAGRVGPHARPERGGST
jgi:phosphoribosylglycinamide formyltransferase 1